MTVIRFPGAPVAPQAPAGRDVLKEAAECRQWADVVKLAHYAESGGPNVRFNIRPRTVECTYEADDRSIRLDILYMPTTTAQLLLDGLPEERVTITDAKRPGA